MTVAEHDALKQARAEGYEAGYAQGVKDAAVKLGRANPGCLPPSGGMSRWLGEATEAKVDEILRDTKAPEAVFPSLSIEYPILSGVDPYKAYQMGHDAGAAKSSADRALELRERAVELPSCVAPVQVSEHHSFDKDELVYTRLPGESAEPKQETWRDRGPLL